MQEPKQRRYRFSKAFRHICKALAIYLIFCAIATLIPLIAIIFNFFPDAITAIVMHLVPTILRIGCLLLVGFIAVAFYEGICGG
jgi:hypothetical protein